MTTLTPDPIMQIASGFMASKFLFAANELGVFQALDDSPADVSALAARTGLSERSTGILANGCVALGLLELDHGRYRNSPEAAAFLVGGGLGPGLRFWDQISYRAWSGFSDALATGPSVHAVEYDPSEQQVMLAGIEAILAGATYALAATVDLADRSRLLDVGCGTGSWTFAVLARNPHLQATLLDLPSAISVAQARLAESGFEGRVDVVAADVADDLLPIGHDVVMVNNLVHYFAPETNRRILGRLAEVSAPGTLLLLADFWTDSTHTQPAPAALLAGEFAVQIVDGNVHSLDEIRAWFADTGWTFAEHRTLAGPVSLVIGTRAAV